MTRPFPALGAAIVRVAAPVALAGAALVWSGATAPAAGAAACTDSAGRPGIDVRVVIDLGGSRPATSTEVCVADGATGADVLAERARVLGTPMPRTHAQFLAFLCAIDGTPSSGCAVDNSTDSYWAYWTGRSDGTTWTYATVGMVDRRVHAGDVDGWRLTPIGGRRVPPRRCVDGTDCPSGSPTTTTPPAVPVPPAPAAATAGPAIAAPPATSIPGPRAAAGPAAGSAAPSGSGATSTTAPGTTVTPTSVPAPDAATEVAGISRTRAEVTSTTSAAGLGATEPTAATGTGDDGGGAEGTWAALAVVLAAGGLALVQSRRTRLRR